MKTSIDVVIPSFRLEEKYILPILQLPLPETATVRFYLVADNPAIVPAPAIRALVDGQRVFLYIHPENRGAAMTRNTGLEAGRGEWVLFLDDDIVVPQHLLQTYARAALQQPGEIGFIGLIHFPPAASAFTKAIQVSGSMDIFSIAGRKPSFAWGATANIMVKRSAIGEVRFSAVYPKSGGGEDMDFFLHVRERNGFRDFRSLPEAAVQHPWWNNDRVNFTRPYRYGKGNSWLGQLNPRYTYYDFLNTPETLLLAVLAGIVLVFVHPLALVPLVVFLAGVMLIEAIASAVQALKRDKRSNMQIMFYVMALRLVHDIGMLQGKLSRGGFHRIGERFHDNGVINKWYFYRTNTYKLVKWVLYPLLGWAVWRLF
ncbi:MAG TPA: glycosyltransferase [Chitinophaga sp.]